ncbi:hypothetical protein PSHT_01311 [Puccinia striiformis]|uniref:Uncharacterized protein n=1 Tax=Puccinia striiformis TaxID=27350 RepID=A0A2S4WKU3_9BASI|nr:hypothetical protein PSHT_01311 [Puccinia striiformis]
MNKDEDPLKINLPDSDYKSVNEDFISPEDSDNLSVEQYLPEIAKKILICQIIIHKLALKPTTTTISLCQPLKTKSTIEW